MQITDYKSRWYIYLPPDFNGLIFDRIDSINSILYKTEIRLCCRKFVDLYAFFRHIAISTYCHISITHTQSSYTSNSFYDF
jgi:hypothetical protein